MPEPAPVPVAEPEETEIPAATPFAQVLHLHRGAGLHNEAGEKLAELVAAVLEHQRKGTLTLTLKVAPAEAPGAIVLTDELKLKAPEPVPDGSLFFGDRDGNLSRRDPRQAELPLRDASAR